MNFQPLVVEYKKEWQIKTQLIPISLTIVKMPVNFFKVEKLFLSSMWFWPSPELIKTKEIFKIIVNSFLILVAVAGEVIFACANFKSDLPIALNALGPFASKVSVLLKVLVLCYNRREVMECLSILKRKMESGRWWTVLEENLLSPPPLPEINGDYSVTIIRPLKISNLASIVLAVNITITCIYYMTLPIGTIIIAIKKGTPYEKHTPFEMLQVLRVGLIYCNNSPTYIFADSLSLLTLSQHTRWSTSYACTSACFV